MSRPIQFLYDALLRIPVRNRGAARRLALVASRLGLQTMACLLRDPVVRYSLGAAQLELPVSHALPSILLRHPGYAHNIGRIAAATWRRFPDLAMVDVGANIGDTAALVKEYCPIPVLCIDGDARFFSLLERNRRQWSDVEAAQVFVAAASGQLEGRLESQDGTGHFVADASRNVEVRTLAEIVAQHPRFAAAKLVKIDTDGFDTLILKGALTWLALHKPVLFFEYDPHFFAPHDPAGFEVFQALRDIGYGFALFWENTGEFLTLVRLDQRDLLQDLHHFVLGRRSKRYFDICVVHGDDAELAHSLRADELRLARDGRDDGEA